ncbi:fungal-specific transcription factor domain-containing protein [Thelonectria olida]|uniref:Fungal-specific transcription factor domain-containing protein n=1 Tax=Thelonectria olida TaxID=1576542 RepID=A0A9P8W7W4_9HYPO|nr:fungal-specific transcription factor domain-containing protein [Thelonectria olida]
MMDRLPARTEDKPAAYTDSRDATFRVSTVQDFGSGKANQRQFKRRSGLPSTACHLCRLRKVKCQVSFDPADTLGNRETSALAKCVACERSNAECRWDTIDRRRMRKVRNRNEPHHKLWAEASDLLTSANRNEDVNLERDDADNPTDQFISSANLEALAEEVDLVHTGHSTLDSARIEDTQTVLREFRSLESLEVPNDWVDIQDFILDLEAVQDQDTAPQGQNQDGNSGVGPARTLGAGSKAIKLRFYRRFGPTAVIPGLRRLSLAVNFPRGGSTRSEKGSHGNSTETPQTRADTPCNGSSTSHQDAISEGSTYDLDTDSIHQILDVFFTNFGGFFPFLNPQVLGGHVRSGQASSFLVNAIAALTMRFCPSELSFEMSPQRKGAEWRRGAQFLKRAKEQLVFLLGLPEPEVVAGLLILSWAEFGDSNEAGLWMLSGMAIRMAQDLGFHRSPKTDSDLGVVFYDHTPLGPDGKDIMTNEQSALHQQKARLIMFWSVFIMDVCVSLLTGRPPSLRRSEIEVPPPTARDMKVAQLDFEETVSMQNLIFPQMVQFMIQFSGAVEYLNQNRPSHSGSSQVPKDGLVSATQDLMKQYQSLEPQLAFSIDSYRTASTNGHSGLFLMLHLYFYTFVILSCNPDSRDTRQNNSEESEQVTNHDQETSRTSTMACQKIMQMLNTAELIDPNGYLSSPFTSHCFFITASAILESPKSSRACEPGGFLALVGGSDFDYLCQKLHDQARYFRGTTATISALEKRGRDLRKRTSNQAAIEEESDGDADPVLEPGDAGIVNRYTIHR